MKYLLFTLLSLIALSTTRAQAPIAGVWNTGKENTKVEIKLDDGQYNGTIMSSDNEKAPLGKLLIKEISKAKPHKGKIFVARQKKWFDAEFTPDGETLFVKVLVGFRSRTIEWKKETE